MGSGYFFDNWFQLQYGLHVISLILNQSSGDEMRNEYGLKEPVFKDFSDKYRIS